MYIHVRRRVAPVAFDPATVTLRVVAADQVTPPSATLWLSPSQCSVRKAFSSNLGLVSLG